MVKLFVLSFKVMNRFRRPITVHCPKHHLTHCDSDIRKAKHLIVRWT